MEKLLKIRASASGKMLNAKGASSVSFPIKELRLKKIEEVKKLNERYESLKNKQCKTALEIVERLPILENETDDLEPLINKAELSETTKIYIKEWLISQVTGKRKVIYSKYLRRGIDAEDSSIERGAKTFGIEMIKNEQYFENDHFCGTPDVLTEDYVIDFKTPFDAFTFPYFMTEPPLDYVAQLQVYMELTGKRKAKLCYCLENGTLEQINKLAWQKAKDSGHDEPTIEDWDEAEADLNYDHLDDHLRIKTFEIEYDATIIENLKESVIFAREYIETELMPCLAK